MSRKYIVFLVIVLASLIGSDINRVLAATGAPRILNYQGRLMDSNGNLLGGSGTDFCFRFSIYDAASVGSGSKVWPTATPSTMTIPVKNGVFNAGIGDTGAGGDTLDFNFQDNDSVYLNVDVATKAGATCAPGDGAEVYETLSPRQRLLSSGYAVNANTVGGFSAAQSASGNQIPALTSDVLVLSGTAAGVSAASTNSLTIQGGASGDIQFFNTTNKLDTLGNLTLGGSIYIGDGTATSTLQSSVVGTSTIQGFLEVLGTNSTSTFSGGVSVQSLSIGSLSGILRATAGSISVAQVDLAADVAGILGITNGGTGTSTVPEQGEVLVGNASGGYDYVATSTFGDGNFSTTSADYYANSSTTIPKTYTSNSFTVLQTFSNASTTNFSASYASSTQANFGSVVIGTLTGVLHAASGVVSAAAVNLASEVTGFLGIGNGGTGTSTVPALGQVLVGNASGGYDYVASTTFNKLSTTSADYYVNSSSTIPKTYTTNIFTQPQIFMNASTTLVSASNGQSTTTIIGQATSTFGAGVQATALNLTGAATSTFANGVDLANGCFSINGTCVTGGGGGGGNGNNLLNIQVFTASGTATYIPSAGAKSAEVIITGGGGGGGLGAGTNLGGAGGSGGTSIAFVDLTSTSSVQVTVGGAGASRSGASATGGSGGYTRFSTFAYAYGGNGGVGGSAAAGGLGGVAGIGDVALPGAPGSKGASIATDEAQLGGASYWGGGAGFAATSTVYGAGGGDNISSGTSGAGGSGIVVVYEYGPFTGIMGTSTGGTGLSAAPAYGQVLLGNSAGGYDLVATSSLGTGFSTTSAIYFVHSSTTIPKTYTANTYTAKQTFGDASTTNFSASYASSTQANFGSVVIGTLTGVLHAASGVVSAAAVNLASEVTGFLGITNGGTGTSTAPTLGKVLVGNVSGGYDYVATSTFGTPDGTFSTTSADYYTHSSTTIVKTYTSNVFTMPQTFQSGTSLTGATSTSLAVNGSTTVSGKLNATGGAQLGSVNASGSVTISGDTSFQAATSTSLAVTGSTTVSGQFNATGGAVLGDVTITNASTTNLSSFYASSTQASFGSVVVGTLSGVVHAAAGLLSTSLVDLATEVTGILGIANGGTGTSTAPATGQLLIGNASGGYDYVSTSSLNIDISNITGTTLESQGGTGQTTYTLGDILYASAPGTLSRLPIGSSGQVLKVTGGIPAWGADQTSGGGGGGGGGFFASTTDDLAIYPGNTSYTVIIGTNATSTKNSIFEVSGRSYFSNNVWIATTSSPGSLLSVGGVADFNPAGSIFYSDLTVPNLTVAGGLSVASLSVGSLTGFLKASAGSISTSLVDLSSDITGTLATASGGTGWTSIVANTLLTGNDAGAIATTTIGSSLQLSGGTLDLNIANPNVWSGLQSFSNSSTSVLSVFKGAFFGGTATTTIDDAGNVAVAGTLSAAATSTLATTTASSLFVTGSSTLQNVLAQNATTTNATSTSSFATTASSTNTFATSAKFGSLTSGPVTAGGAVVFNSTLAVTGLSTLGSASSTLVSVANGSATTTIQGQATSTFGGGIQTNSLGIGSLSGFLKAVGGFVVAASVNLASDVGTSILSVVNGGTGWANLAAGTLLTGNGSGAIATTTVGSSLQISGGSLSLNLANANIWTGLQQFSNSTTTFLESVTQYARTIQSTSTNALVLKTNFTSTAGLTLGSTSTPQMISLDTFNNRVTVGPGGSNNPTLLVADTGNSTDPPGVNGALYYSSTLNAFRCYSNGSWRYCGGQAASSTGDVQIKNADGSFTATDNLNWALASNGLTIKGNSGQTGDLFTVASSTGVAMLGVSSAGVLEFATTTDPATPPSGQLNIYAKDVAGRILPKWIGPSGLDTPFQPALFGNNIAMWFPDTGATVSIAMGTSWTARNSGTGAAATTPAITSTSLYTSMKRALFSTGTTATGSSGTQSSQLLVWRGSGAGLGGFFYFARVGVDSTYRSDVQMMTGLSALNGALTGEPSAQNNSILLGKDSTDTTWQIITRSASAVTKTDTGLTIASGQVLDFYAFAAPGDSKVTVRLVSQTSSGSQVIVDNLPITTNLPVNTTFMYAHHQIRSTTGTATAGYALNRIYVESDI